MENSTFNTNNEELLLQPQKVNLDLELERIYQNEYESPNTFSGDSPFLSKKNKKISFRLTNYKWLALFFLNMTFLGFTFSYNIP